jgi:hypothetical protein
MARDLEAAGYFKRMSGSWLPETDRFLYQANDKIFVKRTAWPAYEQVGGGEPGNAPAESARILFWNGTCRVCDLNLVKVYVRSGMANTGKLVLTMSQDDSFQEGWFVAIESIVSQMTIPLLTLEDNATVRASYVDARLHTRRFDQAPIAEDNSFINWPFPSLNVIGLAEEDWQDHFYFRTNEYDYINSLDGFYGNYPKATDRRLKADAEAHQFTARVHKLTCGTVSSGSRTTISTQSVWTGIIRETDPPSGEMWLGLGDNFVRAGLNRHVFLPPMPLTHLQRDRLQPPNRFWKVEAIPGEILTVNHQFGPVRSRLTSGIAAIRASGTLVLGTHVTESPKDRSRRSSLVTSSQGLIWGGGVLPGINAEHTRKASFAPTTVFPFDQPQQPRALAIGASKARPASLTATFTTTATKRSSGIYGGEFPPEPIPVSSDYLKPKARVRQNKIVDESGRIGRLFNGWDVGSTDFTEVPQNEPWVGFYDTELEYMQANPYPSSIITGAGFWYGGSDQTQRWKTAKADSYYFDIEKLSDLPYVTLSGTYVGTNVMPDGTPSAPDMFYAAPELPELTSVPTLLEPLVSQPSESIGSYYDSTITKPQGYGDHFVDSVFSYAENIPFLYASHQRIGQWKARNTFFNTTYEFDPDYRSTDYRTDSYDRYRGMYIRDIAGWRRKDESHTNTSTKLSAQLTFSTERYEVQAVAVNQNPSDATPQSDFLEASTSQFDDYMTRLCAASRITVVKSCRWIPKQTQMFMTINRETYHPSGGRPNGWGYYGGEVPEEDRLEMLDQYRPNPRAQVEPTGGTISFYIRRTWQIELVLASGAAAYTPMEVISDNVTSRVGYGSGDARYGGQINAYVTFTGTRTAKCGVEFDLESAETTTHLMNHQQTVLKSFYFTELEWERLEAGEAIEKDIPFGGSSSRVVYEPNIEAFTYADIKTKVVFQFT